jgi:hypothetical protein
MFRVSRYREIFSNKNRGYGQGHKVLFHERGRSTQDKPTLSPNPTHNQTWLLYVPPMTQG